MKRFFRNLKTLAMVAMVGFGSLAVSCSEAYDDSQIKADIEDLKSRVEALEVKLTNEVNTLKALIDSKVADLEEAIDAVENKIAILDYEQNADGSWTLTTKDGKDITIYPEAKQNGLAVVEENGVYYWAQVTDGVTTILVDKDGNKYAVHHATVVPEIPECHAEPQVRQDDNGNNEVSFDGGKNWYSMGGGDLGLFQKVTVSEDRQSLTFVLNNGDTFTTSLPEEFKFSIKSGKLFFAAEQEITVDLVLQAIEDVEVLAKPEGWKASIAAGKLTVVAPAEGTGAIDGVVKVLAITGENKAAFAKLYVSAGKGYGVAVEEVEGVKTVVIRNEMVEEVDYGWEGIYTLHPSLFVSMMPKAEFDELGAQGVVDAISNYEYNYYTLTTEQAMYDPENPVYEVSLPLSEVWMDTYWEPLEIVPGVEYIIWAATYVQGASYWDPVVPVAENMVYTTYVERSLEIEEVSAAFNDVQIEVNVAGYNSYRVLFGSLEYMTGWENNDFYYWQQGWDEFGFVRTDATFTGSLFDFGFNVDGWAEKEQALPGKDYLLLVLPIEDGKAVADYTTDDVLEYVFSTSDVTKDGSIKPTITAIETGYTNVKAQFDAEGAALVYYQYYRAAAWSAEMDSWDNETWAAALLSGGTVKINSSSFTYNLSAINMGEEVHFAAIAVDKDGKYGEVAVEKFTSKDFEFKAGFTTAIELADADGGKARIVTPTATGGEAVKYRYQIVNNEWTWTSTYGGTFESAGKYVATQTNTYYFKEVAVADLVDGTFTLSGLTIGSKYWLVVMAVDAEGNFGQPAGVEFTPTMAGEIIFADEANYSVGEPTLEPVSFECTYPWEDNDEWSDYIVKVKLTPSADANMTYIARFDSSYEDSYPSEWSLMEYVVNRYNPSYADYYITYGYTMAYEGTDPVEITLFDEGSVSYESTIYLTWQTVAEDGTIYYRECKKYNVREFCGMPLKPADEGTEEGGEGDGGAVVAPL